MRFSFGDSLGVGDNCQDDRMRSRYMWYCGNEEPSGTKPVGMKLPNAFGLYDMHGNVWEWCQDWYRWGYTGAPTDGSAWVFPSDWGRVVRSGSWWASPFACRSPCRSYSHPTERYKNIGLRVAAVQ